MMEDDEEPTEEEKNKKADEFLLEIFAEIETALEIANCIEQTEGITLGELSEEDEMVIDEIMMKRKGEFNPENYHKNTENEDNFEKPKKNQVRAMYKGINKPAVVWLLDKEGKNIEETIGGEFEKIPYKNNIYVYANKNREELDPNFVLHYEDLIRGKVLFIEEKEGKLKSMNAHTMLDIKDDIRATRVLYINDDNERGD